MAQIIYGAALSHSPQTCVGPELWDDLAQSERGRAKLLGTDAQLYTFDELVAMAPPEVAVGLEHAVQQDAHERTQAAIAQLSVELHEARPDVVVIIGDDQGELFLDDGMPVFAMFWGDEMTDYSRPPERVAAMSEGVRQAFLARHATEPETYPVHGAMAKQIVLDVLADGFDIFQFTEQRPDRSLGHAFTTIERRIIGERSIPMIPIFQNTYFPPNTPSPARCFEFGESVRRSIERWAGSERVAVVASGGLSHITVDEPLDREVLRALSEHDAAAIKAIPQDKMRFGTSEILNWVTAGGLLDGLQMSLLEYFPSYRSEAGTGCGMGFARWTLPS